MSGGAPAARVGDPIAHTEAKHDMIEGALIGALLGAALITATVLSGGTALVVLAAAGGAAGLTSMGGLGGKYIGESEMGPACGKLVTGSANVFINGKPAATMTLGATAACDQHAGTPPLASGSKTVLINRRLAGRQGEITACSAVVVAPCSPNVFIGGPSARDADVAVTPEVPAWAVHALQALGVAGAIMALPASIAAVGVAATVGGGVMAFVGGAAATKGARALGEAMHLSEPTIRKMEVGAGFLGSLAGGAVGVKGVQGAQGALAGAAPSKYSPEVIANADRLGIPPAKVQSILDTAKPNRPMPETYIPADRLAEHADAFKDGGSRLTLQNSLDKFGLGQKDGTTFISTRANTDNILAEANGDPRKLEAALGLPNGQLDNAQLTRVDFSPESMNDLGMRMPSGNEAGANDQWLPGGLLPSGANEAVVDGANALPHQFVTTNIDR